MVRSVRTGANVYVLYGYESSYAGSATVDRAFGLKTAVSSLTLNNNRTDLNKLGQIETNKFAYGTQNGSIGISYVLADSVTNGTESSGDIFKAIYGAPSVGGVYPAGGIGEGLAPKTSETMTFNVGVETSETATYKTRVLKGAILNSLSLSTSIGDPVNVSADFTYGDEDMSAVAYSAPTIVCGTPYTFAQARLRVKLGAGSLTELTLVQDLDITFALNNELLFGLNSHQAVDSYRRVLDITGRFKVSLVDYVFLERVLAQIGKGTTSDRRETLANTAGTIEAEILFTNGTRSIKIELQDVSITDLAWSGLEPVEPLFEEVNFKCKTAQVTVDTTA